MSTFAERAAARRATATATLHRDLHTVDRRFDIEFWQAQGPAAIFEAAWAMVQDRRRFLGEPGAEPRLQRQIEGFVRRGR